SAGEGAEAVAEPIARRPQRSQPRVDAIQVRRGQEPAEAAIVGEREVLGKRAGELARGVVAGPDSLSAKPDWCRLGGMTEVRAGEVSAQAVVCHFPGTGAADHRGDQLAARREQV